MDAFAENTKNTTVMLEGSSPDGRAPKVWQKTVFDSDRNLDIKSDDLKTFEKCTGLNIYVVRGKINETAITNPATRIRSITYAKMQTNFRD